MSFPTPDLTKNHGTAVAGKFNAPLLMILIEKHVNLSIDLHTVQGDRGRASSAEAAGTGTPCLHASCGVSSSHLW